MSNVEPAIKHVREPIILDYKRRLFIVFKILFTALHRPAPNYVAILEKNLFMILSVVAVGLYSHHTSGSVGLT